MKDVKRNSGCSRLKKSSKHPMNFGDIIHAVKSELEIKPYFYPIKTG